MYSEEEKDRLAASGAETLCFRPGAVAEYDVELYERIPRKLVTFGKHRLYDIPEPQSVKTVEVPAECLSGKPFHNHLRGFRRNTLFTPDGIGKILADSGIVYTDGAGNGLYEGLRICRKYGLRPVFEAPAMGFALPFLENERPAFMRVYREKLMQMRRDLADVERLCGERLVRREHHPWVLWLRYSPLALYFASMERDPVATSDELERETGVRKAPADTHDPYERAAIARFWALIRRRHAELLLAMSEALREHIVGDGVIVGNMHANPIVNYGMMNRVFDMPGVAVRPCYLEDTSLHPSYAAYTVQLFGDLTGKPPIVSVRTNLLSAGLRFVPGPNVVKQWYGIAARSGAAGFYFWPRDFSGDSGGYDGPMCGNPDPSTFGEERWDTHLEVLSALAGRPAFVPPKAEVALLVSADGFDRAGWLKAFDMFRRFYESSIHVRFVDIEEPLESWSTARLVAIPTLPICSDIAIEAIRTCVRNGATVVTGDEELGELDFEGRSRQTDFRYQNLRGWRSHSSTDGNAASEKTLWVWKSHEPDRSADRALLHGICRDCSVNPMSWIFDVDLGSYSRAVGVRPGIDRTKPDPDVTFEHYLYEHSSDWALPQYRGTEDEAIR